jgi:two-component system, NarL family, response regulator LiaR
MGNTDTDQHKENKFTKNHHAMIRLFVIEDHPIIVTGLRNLFRPSRDDVEITGSAPSVDEAIQKNDPDSFDLILLDLWLHTTPPLENVKKLKEHFPTKPIVIFTSEGSSLWQRKMFDAGVRAYLLKTAEKSEIKLTLDKVMQGMTVFASVMEDDYLHKKLGHDIMSMKRSLTANQLEIVRMLSNGMTQQKIADTKGTTVSNIEKTLKHIREVCDAKNNTELVRILVEHGII